MLLVQNHHVIVPKTEELSVKLPHIVTEVETARQAHVQHLQLENAGNITLDFIPLSDLWLEVYVDRYRLINPRYATHETRGIGYENYNLRGQNVVEFKEPVTGNVTIVCDTLPYNIGETLHRANVSGATITFENIQNYDTFEKRFNPTRFPMPSLGLRNTLLRVRVGDAHYSYPVILQQPCYGHAIVSKDRKSIVYIPRVGFQGWDVFGYTLMSQHGQMGKPESCTVQVYGNDLRYNWSADFKGNAPAAVREFKSDNFKILNGKKVTFEFYYFTRQIADEKNFKVGVFGQYRDEPKHGRYAVFLESTGLAQDQVVTFQYCLPATDFFGNPIYLDYKLSSKAKFKQQQWHHVAIEIDSTVTTNTIVHLYVDGYDELFLANDFTGQTIASGDYFLIGAVDDLRATQLFNGYISNFRVLVNELPYTGKRIAVPRRPLSITGNTVIMSLSNGINDPQSIQDMADITRIQKAGNVQMVEVGPFSPVLLSATHSNVRHGDMITVSTTSDYICTYSRVTWTIDANVYVGAINEDYKSGPTPVFLVEEVDQVNVVASSQVSTTGNFIIDDIDKVRLTVNTLNVPMLTKHRVDFYLDQWPLVLETFDVYAEPDGLVLHIEATNDGFARDLINYEHGTLTSLGAYNNSLGGYFTFNGTTDIIVGTDNIMNNITDNVTCEVWFRVQVGTVGNVRIFGKGNTGTITYGLYYDSSADQIKFIRNGPEYMVEVVYTESTSIVSNWYQIVGITEEKQHKLYVNGVKVIEKTHDYGPYLKDTNPYTIGADNSVFHNGQISVVKLYNRALSDTDVANNFDIYRARYGL